ncbi:MAG: dihydrofolate reductase [Candidatus Liptonbacteria bacterium]|nr:dihydrofolate reductase [Candidatus Liptonbacteria bacterium]
MKIILYMAITANGYIARENGDTPWSEEEFKAYYGFVKERGNVMVGWNTYELMKSGGEFEKCGNPFVVIVSRDNKNKNENEANACCASSPREAVEVLAGKGFKEVVVGGGGTLNAGFLKGGLIDELILDVEPLIFGKGIKLFKDTDMEARLELLETRALSKNTVRLRYKVVK